MRKLVLKMSVTTDGFVGGPNGEIDWLLNTMDESALQWIANTLWQAGVHIMGRRTFYDMVNYWPTSSDPLAAPMNEIPKVVFSHKDTLDWDDKKFTTQAIIDSTKIDQEKGINPIAETPHLSTWLQAPVASGNIVDEIAKLKAQDGNFILAHGGASFVQELVKYDLIDEFRLLVHPVAIGKGLPLFSSLTKPLYLKLESSEALKKGIIANVYTRARD